MTLYNLYIFLEIVKDMNLHVTAERLFVSQQSLSVHIKQIESYYGVTLFERKPKFKLTKNGEELRKEAKLIMNSDRRLKLMFNKDNGNTSGVLRIGCSMVRSRVYMPKVLSIFNAKYPGVSIQFVRYNGFKEDYLHTGKADIVIGHQLQETEDTDYISLFPVASGVSVHDRWIDQYVGRDRKEEFIENARRGLDIKDLPADTQFVMTKGEGRNYLFSNFPEMKHRAILYVNPTATAELLDLCLEGEYVFLFSMVYMNYLKKSFPEEMRDIHIFPQLFNKKPLIFDETCTWVTEDAHPEYFYEFIEILRENAKGFLNET